MDKKLVIGGAILAAVLLMGQKGETGSGRKYWVPAQYSPTGQAIEVYESDLPRYGFIQYQGQWYHSSQYPPQGISSNSSTMNWVQWAQIVQQGIDAGLNVYTAVNNVVQQFQPGITITPAWNTTSQSATDGSVQYIMKAGTQQKTGTANINTTMNQIAGNFLFAIERTSNSVITFSITKMDDGTIAATKSVNFATNTIT